MHNLKPHACIWDLGHGTRYLLMGHNTFIVYICNQANIRANQVFVSALVVKSVGLFDIVINCGIVQLYNYSVFQVSFKLST